jgi:3',5'-cyclic AMP phosphodiesterase CpdA
LTGCGRLRHKYTQRYSEDTPRVRTMSLPALPRILGPNLGCPEIVSAEQLHQTGFEILVADGEQAGQSPTRREGDAKPLAGCSLWAVPSVEGEGAAFELVLSGLKEAGGQPREVTDDELPPAFKDIKQTRRMVSTTLRAQVFEGKARFWVFRAKTRAVLTSRRFRRVDGHVRSTLYDLELRHAGKCLHRVPHALCLRVPSPQVRFVHLTDLHLAERNDLWDEEQASLLPRPSKGPEAFTNFNERARRFIHWANEQADEGELDFVLALGDLVDFVEQGITEPHTAPNNWQVFTEILTGAGIERDRDNPGLKVPVFTTTGNHDWRTNPYPPERASEILGLQCDRAKRLDYVYRDSPEAAGKRIEEVHERLVKEGSPILARSWWHTVVSFGLRGLMVLWDRVRSRLLAWANSYLRLWFYAALAAVLGGVGAAKFFPFFQQGLKVPHTFSWRHLLLMLAVAVAVYLLLLFAIAVARNWMGSGLRKLIEDLISIESSLGGLRDYFLRINPYFNYAFRLENCYFLLLDTGHDCLTAQSFWDEGGKKVERVRVKGNMLGGSPDTMGFYQPNPYFPYSQIAWLERVLDLIGKQHHQQPVGPRKCRVFVGLHSPPANLEPNDRRRADAAVEANAGKPIPLRKRWRRLGGCRLLPMRWRLRLGYNIRYGTINHYLSQFYYLCLGAREEDPAKEWGCGVDVALAGHAHWQLEFKLERPESAAGNWKPTLHYGHFSDSPAPDPGSADKWIEPLLLQTAACGPPNLPKKPPKFPDTPYYRLIRVEPDHRISTLKQHPPERRRDSENASAPPAASA